MTQTQGDVAVARWRRYGKDRLYVTAGDGTKIGWWDLQTDEAHPESVDLAGTLAAAIQSWRAPQAEPVVQQELPSAEPRTLPPERPWIDFATNAPGAEVRRQAVAAREAAPVRSFLARMLDAKTDERAWRLGADGEERVATRLAKLAKKDPRWRTLHAIPVGDRGSDIDHLVVGPGGIFTVNTKHHPGARIWVGGDTFMIDGHRQPYVRNSRHEAARASKLLTAAVGAPVHVEGVIVTVNADDVTIKKAPADVHVVPRMQVARWLQRHGDLHDEAMLDAVYEAARRSTTWRPQPLLTRSTRWACPRCAARRRASRSGASRRRR